MGIVVPLLGDEDAAAVAGHGDLALLARHDQVQSGATSLGGMLNPPVGVVDQAVRGPLTFYGHVEGLQGDLDVQGLAHGPADDLAGVDVGDGGEVEPAFSGRDVDQIGEPDLVGSFRLETSGEP